MGLVSETTHAPYVDAGGFAPWQPPATRLERALVLAGGGVTGIAWEA